MVNGELQNEKFTFDVAGRPQHMANDEESRESPSH